MGCALTADAISNQRDLKVSIQDISTKAITNKILQDYEIDREPIGKGAFGQVRKAMHRRLGLTRVIKILKRRKEDSQQEKRILNELAILRLLDHPNIIKVYQFYKNDKYFFIVTEFCEGGELFDHVIQQTPNEDRIRKIVQVILYAVSYLHSMKVVHRDLKPQNILFENKHKNSNLKVIDFGVSAIGEDKFEGLVGTPYYIAPEVLKQKYGKEVDIWSVGVILYMLIHGRPPFNGKSQKEIFAKITNNQPDLNTEQLKIYSPNLKSILKIMLNKDVRRPSAKQLLAHDWFTSEAVTQNKISIPDIKRLKQFSVLQKASWLFITNNFLSAEDKQSLMEEFNRIDKDKDGKLSRAQLISQYKRANPLANDDELNQMVDTLDLDKSQFVQYSQFVMATVKKDRLLNQGRLKMAYDLFDKGGKGFIKLQDIRLILQSNKEVPGSVWSQVMLEMDVNGDGEISFQQFKAVLSKGHELK